MSRGRRHDHDAGGDRDLLDAKAALREQVWDRLTDEGVARFPGAHGRIPNFTGAEAAAQRLAELDAWRSAGTVKANPDSPQWPVRQRALENGKTVYMAVPKLAADHPFFLLDPDHLPVSPRKASSIKGASAHGRPVDVEDLGPVAIVLTGCVAVSLDGARLGKGGGFADLELAVAAAAGLVSEDTLVVTTVHELQVVDEGEIPMAEHDLRVDLVVTPERAVEVRRTERNRIPNLHWDELTDAKIDAIPLLRRLRG